MNKRFRFQLVLVAVVLLAGTVCFAEDGAAIYKTKCAMCHGPTGTPSAGMAKMLGIKPVSDPSMKSISMAQVEIQVKNGKGKMKPIAGLSDAQVKAVAEYFKTLK
ncbi:MAG TPA: cytochrome c [Terracidiphilus sp.]|nr:cytochrome c [Terracidiphilus sp.]